MQGQSSGLAVGLFSTNTGAPPANTFQAVFDEIEITAVSGSPVAEPPPFFTNAGSNNSTQTSAPANISSLPSLAGPSTLFNTERWDRDNDAAGEMQWAFDVEAGTNVEVKLYLSESYANLPDLNNSGDRSGARIFDISVDGTVPETFANIDTFQLGGNQLNKASVLTQRITSDGTIDLEFIHKSQHPAIKAIEIVAMDENDLLVRGEQQVAAQRVEAPLLERAGQSLPSDTAPSSSSSFLANLQLDPFVEPSLLAVESVA